MEMDLVKRNVRGDQVKAYHQFLAGDFGFWIMTSEKPSEARSHPSGCLSLWKDQKKSGSILVTSRTSKFCCRHVNRFS